MVLLFKFPDVGEGIQEGTVVKILAGEGKQVKADEPMFEVETDKAVVELPAPQAGTILKVYVKQGDAIKVGQVIIAIGQPGEKAPENPDQAPAAPALSPDQAAQSPKMQALSPAATAAIASRADAGIRATPAVRAMAQKLGVDLAAVTGTGAGGRIMPSDVESAAKTPQPSAGATASQLPVQTAVPAPQAPVLFGEFHFAGPVEKVPLSATRKAITEKMTRWLSIPQAGVSEDFDLTSLYELREKLKRENGKAPTYLAFIAKAIALSLKKHPALNASFLASSSEIAYKKYYNIGIAVDTENGLVVPVVKNADSKGITEIGAEIEKLAAEVRERKAHLNDLRDSTFSITNVGSVGGVATSPVINYAESAILGLSKLRDTPVVYQGRIVARKIMRFDLGFDHRVLDGADGMRFLADVKELLENPEKLAQYL